MKIRALLVATIAGTMTLFAAPTASAGPSDYNCSTQIIDQTTNQVLEQGHLKRILMYAEAIGIGDNKFMPYTSVPYMIRTFDDLPNNMSANDYHDAWIDACGTYYQHLGDFKYRPYVLIVADQNGDAGIYSNVFVGDNIVDMVNVSTGRMRANIALGDFHDATAQAISDTSSLLADVNEAPATQQDQADDNAWNIVRWVGGIIIVSFVLVCLIIWATLSSLKRQP